MDTKVKHAFNIKARIFQRKYLFLLKVLLITGYAHCQSINNGKYYHSQLERLLNPQIDTLKEKEVALFVSRPSSSEPEYSIRIIDKGNQSFIEARILGKNLWQSQFKQNRQTDTLPVNAYFYSASVSSSFRNKMIQVFSKIIVLNQNREKPNAPRIFDGTCYEFRINNNGEIVSTLIDSELKYTDLEYQVAMTNFRIVEALKKQSFHESVYQVYN